MDNPACHPTATLRDFAGNAAHEILFLVQGAQSICGTVHGHHDQFAQLGHGSPFFSGCFSSVGNIALDSVACSRFLRIQLHNRPEINPSIKVPAKISALDTWVLQNKNRTSSTWVF